jgi:hypothetical protein
MIICGAAPEVFEATNGTGVIGWYCEAGQEVTTVLIRYGGLNGLPYQVIEATLAELPSTVERNDLRATNWVTDDLAKWADILATRRDDRIAIESAGARLMQHDRASFGVLEALRHRNDPTAFNAALDEAIRKIEARASELQAASAELIEDPEEGNGE